MKWPRVPPIMLPKVEPRLRRRLLWALAALGLLLLGPWWLRYALWVIGTRIDFLMPRF